MRIAQVARKRLKGHWKAALAASLLPTVTVGILTVAEWLLWRRYGGGWWCIAALAADGLLCSPLQLGRARWFARLAAGEPPRRDAFTVFFRKKGYARALKWRWGIAWRSAVAAAVCGLPAAVLTAAALRFERTAAGDAVMVALFAQGLYRLGWVLAVLVYAVWRGWLTLATYAAAVETADIRHIFASLRHRWNGQYSTFLTRAAGFIGWGCIGATVIFYPYTSVLFCTVKALYFAQLPPISVQNFSVKHGKKRALSGVTP